MVIYTYYISGELSISDVIFPDISIKKNVDRNCENKTDLYKISHHYRDTGEQFNRKLVKPYECI